MAAWIQRKSRIKMKKKIVVIVIALANAQNRIAYIGDGGDGDECVSHHVLAIRTQLHETEERINIG